MVTIRNASSAGRGLPGGPTIPSGHSVTMPGVDWAEMVGHPVVAFWIAAGDLMVTDDEPLTSNPDGAGVNPASVKDRKG